MTVAALYSKELGAIVRNRRLLYYLLGVGVLTTVVFLMITQFSRTPSLRTYVDMHHFLGPLFAGFLALTLSGDAIARERQDRTFHLLFTAPVTKAGYLVALLASHATAFLAFIALSLVIGLTVGLVAGWVAVEIVLLIVVFGVLPTFLLFDAGLVAVGTRIRSGRTGLILATFLVLGSWLTSSVSPFSFAFEGLSWWPAVSWLHPFDNQVRIVQGLINDGRIATLEVLKNLVYMAVATGLAYLGLREMEVGL